MMKKRLSLGVIALAVMSFVFGVSGTVGASTSKPMTISGSINGRLSTSNTGDICSQGVPTASGGGIYQATITLPAIRPLKGDWSLEVTAPRGTTHLPKADPITVTLTSPGATDVAEIWATGENNATNGSGTVTLTKRGGSINAVLPGTQHLVGSTLTTLPTEKVVGSWACH